MSAYGYVTLAELEDFCGEDFSALGVSGTTDATVNAKISTAERLVNGKKRESFSGTIPDNVKAVTMMVAANLVHNHLVNIGYAENKVKIWNKEYDDLLDGSMDDIGVDTIPMSGIDRR